MDREVRNAAKKFEAEFGLSKMETMIHRFPAGAGIGDGLRSRYPHMVAPRFVAIGPYHHGEKRLAKMEEVKSAAANYVCQRAGVAPEKAKQAVLAVADEARGKYYDDVGITGTGTDGGEGEGGKKTACFAAMMFRDACFLLLYMDAYNRSYGDGEDQVVNRSMRRFLSANRDSINNDIMLLENQLPWLVVQALLRAVPPELGSDMRCAVGKFVAAMGNSFSICEPSHVEPYEWDDERDPPAHLLALLHRHKTERPAAGDETQGNGNHKPRETLRDGGGGNSNRHHLRHPLIVPPPAAGRRRDDDEENPRPQAAVDSISISVISPAGLQEIGIKLAPSRTASFSDMGLEKGRLFVSRLTLASLSLSDTRAACLVNMAALETCAGSRFRDRPDATGVCSYLTLLAFLMAGTEDVRRLRAMSLLHGSHSDGDTLAFFNAAVEHLPSCGKRFALLMAEIAEYKRTRRIRTTLYRWLHNNLATVVKVVSIIAMIVGLYQGLIFLIRS